jgi:hypothetical protein
MDAPGVIHHVIIRGVKKRESFQDQADREDFTSRLEDLIPETRTRCYAWVLVSDDTHCRLPQWPMPPGEGSDPPLTMTF